MNTVIYTEKDLSALKQEYTKALEWQRESFLFNENEYLTSYAKHLVEHLENHFNQRKGGKK